MIGLPVFWTEYTATAEGRVLKHVPCENCSTEYVYVLRREGTGKGIALYGLIGGDEADAKSGAEEALRCYLENDFDPVPCPVCGHYQRYMFPKLYETKSYSTVFVRFVVLLIGLLDAVGTVHWTVTYLMEPSEYALRRVAATWSLLAVLGLMGVWLVARERANARRFDPNLEDQDARLAKGRSRAVTRAEFESLQQRNQDATGDSRNRGEAGQA
jgi:hypothetical protein